MRIYAEIDCMAIVAFILLTLFNFNPQDMSRLTAAEIMRRVAGNQDREQQARNQFVYEQKQHRIMRSKNGKLLREEYWTYSVIPGPKGTEKKLQSVKGRYLKKGKYLPFEGQPIPEVGGLDVTFDDNTDSSTRDGFDKDLFPLTSEEQTKYTFENLGEQVVNGRPAYRIQFRPLDRHDYRWIGEAFIDKAEFQPVRVYTRLSRKLPFAVRTMLGTDVPGLGMNIAYTRVDKDLWFPSSYGTEYSARALFLLNRTFTESTENMNFRRTSVDSQVQFGNTPGK